MVKTVEERFWAKVNKQGPVAYEGMTPCWLWTGGDDGRSAIGEGYGKFLFHGVYRRAHRVSYMLTHGPIHEGKCIMHKCDTPRCVNPDHLQPGTLSQNMQDMISKGRKGKPSSQRDRLTEKEVIEIYSSDEPNRALARKYNIASTATVRAIKDGLSYSKFTRSLRQQPSWQSPSPEGLACILGPLPSPSRSESCEQACQQVMVQEQAQEQELLP